jgi:2-amino-4-hydroxy-6-hydroxymethyldihydropteridine diphosphokinase
VRAERWGPRTLDLDILLYDQIIENSSRLTLPHPRLHERAFVLVPLADLDPALHIPKQQNITQLLANCSSQGILKID